MEQKPTGFIRLETNRLVLRDHRKEDLLSHHALLSDAEVMYYLPDIKTGTLQESQWNLDLSISEISLVDRQLYFLRIEEKDGTHVGEAGYTVDQFTPFGKLVGLGYFIRKEAWGRGYTSEAVGEIIRFAFEENDVYRISTGCLGENRASERIMVKNGFVKEATFKNKVLHDGRMKDRVEYGLLRENWKQKQDEITGSRKAGFSEPE